MNLITEKEFKDFIKFRDELNELILTKTTQLSILLYNAPPKGHFITNLDKLDEKDGKICVQFESYSCGESDYDTFYLPLEFLFDESYPEKHKLIWEEEKRKEKEEKEKKCKEKEESQKKSREIFERKEYERLKLKFEWTTCILCKKEEALTFFELLESIKPEMRQKTYICDECKCKITESCTDYTDAFRNADQALEYVLNKFSIKDLQKIVGEYQ